MYLHHNIYKSESKTFSSNGTFFYLLYANCVHAQKDVVLNLSRLGESRFGKAAEIAKFNKTAEIADIVQITEIAEMAEVAGRDFWSRLPRLL